MGKSGGKEERVKELDIFRGNLKVVQRRKFGMIWGVGKSGSKIFGNFIYFKMCLESALHNT
jgi:hypothetical protein